MNRTQVDAIVAEIAASFPCFGRGARPDASNPIALWAHDKPTTFALGVDVRDVVMFVLRRSKRIG
jgi:hypothetical protein